MIESKKRELDHNVTKNYKSLKMLFQVYEHTGICGFHYYPTTSRYVALSEENVAKIIRDLGESEMALVSYKGKFYVVENIEVYSEYGVQLAGFVQISPPKILKLWFEIINEATNLKS